MVLYESASSSQSHAVILKQIYPFHYRLQFLLTPFSHFHPLTLSLLCAAAAGRTGIRGPGGGSGVQGPWKPSSAGQMVPPGRGDPGLPRFPCSPEK